MRVIEPYVELLCRLKDRAPVATVFAVWTLLQSALTVSMGRGLDSTSTATVISLIGAPLGIAAGYELHRSVLLRFDAMLRLFTVLYQWACVVLLACCLLLGVQQTTFVDRTSAAALFLTHGAQVIVCSLMLLLLALRSTGRRVRLVWAAPWMIGFIASSVMLAVPSEMDSMLGRSCAAVWPASYLIGLVLIAGRSNPSRDADATAITRWDNVLDGLGS